MPQRLTKTDYVIAAQKLNSDVSNIMTVFSVEAANAGFIGEQMKILFERHWFRKFTKGRFDKTHPHISNRIPGGYAGGAAEWRRFEEAARLDRHAALLSISMGAPQLMGFNFAKAGFPSVEIMFAEMQKGEPQQLNAFVNFIISADLDDELRDENYFGFAGGYNGPQHAKNNYAPRMKAADNKFERQGVDHWTAEIPNTPQTDYAGDASVAIPPPPAPIVETQPFSIEGIKKQAESATDTITTIQGVIGKASDTKKAFRTFTSMATFGSIIAAIGTWFKENPVLSSLIFIGILIVCAFAWKYMTRQEKIGVARVQNQ